MKLSEFLTVIHSSERIRLFGKDQKEPFFVEYGMPMRANMAVVCTSVSRPARVRFFTDWQSGS